MLVGSRPARPRHRSWEVPVSGRSLLRLWDLKPLGNDTPHVARKGFTAQALASVIDASAEMLRELLYCCCTASKAVASSPHA